MKRRPERCGPRVRDSRLTYGTCAVLVDSDHLHEGFPPEGAQDQAAHRRRVASHRVAELACAVEDKRGAGVHAPVHGTRRHGQVVVVGGGPRTQRLQATVQMVEVVVGVRDGVLHVGQLRNDAVEGGLRVEHSGGGHAGMGEGVGMVPVPRRQLGLRTVQRGERGERGERGRVARGEDVQLGGDGLALLLLQLLLDLDLLLHGQLPLCRVERRLLPDRDRRLQLLMPLLEAARRRPMLP